MINDLIIRGFKNHTEFTSKTDVVNTLRASNAEIRIQWYKLNGQELKYTRGIALKLEGSKIMVGKLLRAKEFDPITVGTWEEFDTDGLVKGWTCRPGEYYKVISMRLPE